MEKAKAEAIAKKTEKRAVKENKTAAAKKASRFLQYVLEDYLFSLRVTLGLWHRLVRWYVAVPTIVTNAPIHAPCVFDTQETIQVTEDQSLKPTPNV